MSPGRAIHVHKLDAQGRELWTYAGRVLETTPSSITLEAVYGRDDTEFSGLALRRGDRFVETFFTDRGYNIFAVHAAEDDRLKGWYCNITRPAVFGDGKIEAEDLALDLIVLPDGTMTLLDVDEFQALDLTEEERRQAWGSLEALRRLAETRQGPFAPDAGSSSGA